MSKALQEFSEFIESQSGKLPKAQLATATQAHFALIQDRSIYYRAEFAVRFSAANSANFSNTVVSLSNLQKFDDRIFLVCLVTPSKNYLFVANTTFLKKISHSSQNLRINNIRGSFNGSDIMRDFLAIKNSPQNFEKLFLLHQHSSFAENLARLVEATNNITPTRSKYQVKAEDMPTLVAAPARAAAFAVSQEASRLKQELDGQVAKFQTEIMAASLIKNVNVRGRIIEYLITGEDEIRKREVASCLNAKDGERLNFRTKNTLGDYRYDVERFLTQTDVKTKIMGLNSNPKGYNLDKMLAFLSHEKTVFLFYFVGITTAKSITTALVSIFQEDLLKATTVSKQWAGRASRGVTQFNGEIIKQLINFPNHRVAQQEGVQFLKEIVLL